MPLTGSASRSRLLLLAALAGLSIVAAAIIAIAWTVSRTRAANSAPLALSVLMPPGVAMPGAPALSPDGRAIAFEGTDPEGGSRIWIRSFDRPAAHALPGTDGGHQPFWSPDGESLGFFARGTLWIQSLAEGGPPRALAKVETPRGGTWSRENIIVFASQTAGQLFRIAAEGGPALPLAPLERERQEISPSWPRFLPDGRVIVFMNRSSPDDPRFRISAISVDAASVKPLTEAGSSGRYSNGRLLFYRDGKVLAQSFDTIELNLTGDPVVVTDDVWTGGAEAPGLVGFDAVEGLFAFRPATPRDESIVHLRFNWVALQQD